ncbi:MAG: EAL domain-containing protein [Acidimicrobiales bacterium]
MTFTPAMASVMMAISSLICLGFAIYVQGHRRAVASRSLTAVLVCSALWGAFYGLELFSKDPATKELFGDFKYVGVVLLPMSWLVFTLQFTGRSQLVTRKMLGLLAIEPIIVLGLLAFPQTHDLVRFYPPPPLDSFPIIEVGPLFWVNVVYLNTQSFVATLLFLITLARHAPQYRRQRLWLATGYLLPWVPNVLHNFSIYPATYLDLTPVALSITGPILVWGFFRSRLLDIAPVARKRLVDNMPDGVIVVDTYLRIVDHNPAASQLLELGSKDLIGVNLSLSIPPLAQKLKHGQGVGTHQILKPDRPRAGDRNTTNSVQALEIEITTIEGFATSTDRSAGYLLILRDITKRLANEERLQALAHSDPLTGLANRTLFNDRLNQTLAQARRNNQSFGLLFLDLDRFKVVNDTLGHEIGDGLLQKVGTRLQQSLRDEDTIARIGGDEFTVLMPELSDAIDASIVASKLIKALEQPFVVQGHELFITASIGVASYPLNGASAHDLTSCADSAMYLAKSQGKNRYHLAGNCSARSGDHLRFESDLRHALDNGDLELHFQPCITIGNNSIDQPDAIDSLETLARWHHPRRGQIAPSVFIPMAEEAGLMPALGLWVLEKACQQASEWRSEHGLRVNISVNISAFQLDHHLLARHVLEAIEHSGLAPGQLILELSERTVVVECDPVIAELETLRASGARLALDDFGTGHTSLGQLKRLRFDQLKIDQEFVRDITTDPDNAVIVAAMINLGHSLGMNVVAEGVENSDELEALRLLGCDAVQGYMLGRPIPHDEMTTLLVEKAASSDPAN